jgi:hypothetical protein
MADNEQPIEGEDSQQALKKPKVCFNASQPQCFPIDLSIQLQVQESAKVTWLITYASGSPDITQEMLLEHNIQCNECYTTTWRESKYTLIHLTQIHKKRASVLQGAMKKMEKDHGVKGSIIHGYETLSCNKKEEQSIKDHPGFKRIVQQLNENTDELRIWMQTGDVMTNKTGTLWNYIENRDPKLMTHAQLVEKVTRLMKDTQEFKSLKDSHEALRAAFTAQERELSKEKKQNDDFFKQLCDKMDECTSLKIQINSLRMRAT